MTATLDAASRQWASRPDDQRFLTLEDLAASVGVRLELERQLAKLRYDLERETDERRAAIRSVRKDCAA